MIKNLMAFLLLGISFVCAANWQDEYEKFYGNHTEEEQMRLFAEQEEQERRKNQETRNKNPSLYDSYEGLSEEDQMKLFAEQEEQERLEKEEKRKQKQPLKNRPVENIYEQKRDPKIVSSRQHQEKFQQNPIKENVSSSSTKLQNNDLYMSKEEFDALTTPKISLLKPTDDELFAKGGSHNSYSQKYANDLFDRMHNSGEVWPLQYHEQIFSHGLFNYYFWYFTGIYPPSSKHKPLHDTIRYCGLFNRNLNDVLVFSKTASRLSFKRYYELLDNIEKSGPLIIESQTKIYNAYIYAYYQLQHNEAFLKIGSIFQKQKVRYEKISKEFEIKFPSASDQEKKEMNQKRNKEYKHLDIIQTVIFHWIKEVVTGVNNKIPKFIKPTSKLDAESLEYENNPFFQNIATSVPTFLEAPYYAQALKILKLYDLGEDITKEDMPTNIIRTYNDYLNDKQKPFKEISTTDFQKIYMEAFDR